MLGPTSATKMTTAKNSGKVWINSVKRISRLSTAPPSAPDSSPMSVPMNMAMLTATTPTLIETRPPIMSRDHTSRPAESVPSRCAALGGCLTESRSTAFGARAKIGPKAASSTSSSRTTSETTATLVTREAAPRGVGLLARRGCDRRGARALESAPGGDGHGRLAVADPRVGVGVQDVGHEIAEQYQRRDHQCQAHQHRVVALLDRQDRQGAHARPLED